MSEERLQAFKAVFHNAGGSASPELRQKLTEAMASLTTNEDFGDPILLSLNATELSLYKRPDDGKLHARAVFEIVVRRDMVNAHNMVHGGCMAYLVDLCSSVPLVMLGLATNGPVNHVSQNISTTFHGGASLGAKLRIVNETVSWGSRAFSAKTEIWDATKGRLCVTGAHTKMVPAIANPKL